MHVPNPNTQKRKIFITYYKTYGITTLKKHAYVNHVVIVKKIEKKVNGLIIKTFEDNQQKKGLMQYIIFLLSKIPLKRMMNNKKIFLQGLGLSIMKNKLPL
jgi:hypothetical protein